jgi:hypothetical protein
MPIPLVQVAQFPHQPIVLDQLHLLRERTLQLSASCPDCSWLRKQALVVARGANVRMLSSRVTPKG